MTTMMIGIEDEKVDEVFQIMRDNCAPVADNGIRRATMFVLNVDRFTQV
jgi:uncharacterized protein YaaQ